VDLFVFFSRDFLILPFFKNNILMIHAEISQFITWPQKDERAAPAKIVEKWPTWYRVGQLKTVEGD